MARVREQAIQRLLDEGRKLHSEHLWGRYLACENASVIVVRINRTQGAAHMRNRFRRRVRGFLTNSDRTGAPHQWLIGLRKQFKVSLLTRAQLYEELEQMTQAVTL